jgi:pyruvate-ferredoxin/flavodoxin oxidoreductase
LPLEIGMGRHTNTTLQASFFYLSQQIMPYKDAETWMKHFAEKSYAKKGQAVVDLNYKAIDAGPAGLREVKVDPEWVKLSANKVASKADSEDTYFDEYVDTIDRLDGDDFPTSEFLKYELEDGTMEPNITFRQKRGIADHGSGMESGLLHSVQPVLLRLPARDHSSVPSHEEDELAKAPAIVKTGVKDALPPAKGLKFRIQVSSDELRWLRPLRFRVLRQQDGQKAKDPKTKNLALRWSRPRASSRSKMAPITSISTFPIRANIYPLNTVKGVGFLMPYMEVSGACAGCGEAPYYRLVTNSSAKTCWSLTRRAAPPSIAVPPR